MDWASDPLLTRQLNDQRSRLDRLFLLPEGLPGRIATIFRHALISPAKSGGGFFNLFAFPGIQDLLGDLSGLAAGTVEFVEKVRELDRHVSDLMVMVKAATEFIGEVGEFKQ